MERITEEQFQLSVETIRKSAPEGIRLLNGYLKSDRSSARLLKADNLKSAKINRDTREFTAERPCYIKQVDIYAADPALIAKRLNFVVVSLEGKKQKIEPKLLNATLADGSVTQIVVYSVGYFCKSIQISADTILRQVAVMKFRAFGFTLSQIESAAAKVQEISSLVGRIDAYSDGIKNQAEKAAQEKEAAEQNKSEIEEELEDLEVEKKDLMSQRDDLSKSVEGLMQNRGRLEKDLIEYQARLNSAQNNETQLKQSAESLNREIVEKQKELKEVLNDRHLISDEYKDYVVEGKRQSRVYEWFLYFSIFVIAVCSWQLYVGAQRILLADANTYEGVLSLVLQRAPFAAAIAFIAAVAWKLASMFVSRIMAIHAQRLALTRLLVIAKDTVYSSTDGLDVSDEAKFRERIRLKLQMLKSHLTSELGKDFDYKPQAEKVTPVEVGDSSGDDAE